MLQAQAVAETEPSNRSSRGAGRIGEPAPGLGGNGRLAIGVAAIICLAGTARAQEPTAPAEPSAALAPGPGEGEVLEVLAGLAQEDERLVASIGAAQRFGAPLPFLQV